MDLLNKLRSVDIYNWMILVLSILTALGLYTFYAANFASAVQTALIQVVVAVVIGLVLDTLIIYAKEKKWRLSKSAIISGFFVGTIFAPQPNIAIPVAGIVIAIIQKHILRRGNRPIFNPASFGLIVAGLLFAADHGWWAAAMLPAVIIFGLFIVIVFGRLHLVVSYLLAYWILSTTWILVTGGTLFGLQNRLLDGTMLFFAFLMLIEPRTSPAIRKGRIIYGIIAGVFAAIFIALNMPYFIPLNLLVANIFTRPLEKFFRPKAKPAPESKELKPSAEAAAS